MGLRKSILVISLSLLVFLLLVGFLYVIYPWRNIKTYEDEVTCCKYKKDLERKTIPQTIHHIWWEGEMPQKYEEYARGCKRLNPDYQFIRWNRTKVEKLVRDHYRESIWLLQQEGDDIMYRTDAAKYFIMHKYGGIYMDTDMACRKSFDFIFSQMMQNMEAAQNDVILGEAFPFGCVANFFAAKPESAFFLQVIRNLELTHGERFPINVYQTFLQAGPVFVWKNYKRFPCQGTISFIDSIIIRWDWLFHEGKSTWAGLDGNIFLATSNFISALIYKSRDYSRKVYFIGIVIVVIALSKRKCITKYFHKAARKKVWMRI